MQAARLMPEELKNRVRTVPRAAALLYHNVGEYKAGTYPSLTVSPVAFKRHMEALARRGYHGISASDWQAARTESASLPPKPVILTFDDGYADLAKYAFPVLENHGFRATVFVVTDLIGSEDRWLRREDKAPQMLLTLDDMRSWRPRGIDFGAHSRTHADLTTLTSEALRDEVTGSARALERSFGARVQAFAYPYGYYNADVSRTVGSDFALAFTVEEGMNDFRTDSLCLRRTMVQPNDSAVDVLWRTAMGRHPIESLHRSASRAVRRLLRLTSVAV